MFFRLSVVQLDLPPLRERREDIPLLARHLLSKIDEKSRAGAEPLGVGRDVLDVLSSHDWPGNIRELRNVIERAVYLSRSAGHSSLMLHALPLGARESGRSESTELGGFEPGISYREQRARFEEMFEKRYVQWLLERHENNVSAAAREADMDRKYLHKLAKKHGFKD